MNRDDACNRRTDNSLRALADAERALDRGRALVLPGMVAVYLPGEDVRCPRNRVGRNGDALGLCGGYLFTHGPVGEAHVRAYDDRRFNERRAVSRHNHLCDRCKGRLEIEHHAARNAAA